MKRKISNESRKTSINIYKNEEINSINKQKNNSQIIKNSRISIKKFKINTNFFQILILIIFASFFSSSFCKIRKHTCGIDFLKTPKRIYIPEENSQIPSRKLNIETKWEPIRIHFDFSYIENNIKDNTISKNDLIDLKEKIMPKAKEVFQNLLRVRRIKNKLKLNSPHCETFPIPDIYNSAGDGVEADIVIFVLIDTSGHFNENGIEAAAIHCLQNQETRRPIAGYIQFKQDLNIKNQHQKDYFTWLAIHEISHILVINRALYDDYINPDTLQPLGYDRVIGSKILETGIKVNFIKTPKVLEKAQNHFGCSKLYGLPLEYNGGPGTAGSHWSRRYMNTDYMIGESYGENLISEISLMLFEDSGWYKVNSELANLFIWGKGKGCDFFNREKKCIFSEKIDLDLKMINKTLVEFEEVKNINRSSNNENEIFSVNKSSDYLHIVKGENNDILLNEKTNRRISLKISKQKTKSFLVTNKNSKLNKIKFSFGYNKNINDTKINSDSENINPYKHNSSIFNVIINDIYNNSSKKKYYIEYKTNFKDEFCTNFNMPVCSTSNIFRGICSVEESSDPLEKYEMLFKNTKLAGYEKLLDRCPIAIESRYNQPTYGGSCRYGEKIPTTKTFEKICPECACFMSNLIEKKDNDKREFNKNLRVRGNDLNNFSNELSRNDINEINNFAKELNNKNFLKTKTSQNKGNSNKYEVITTFTKKPRDGINYSFKENINTTKYNEKTNKNLTLDESEEEIIEEYEIIKLNPTYKDEDFIASCFEFKCEKGELYVIINENKYKCAENGNITNIPGYIGGIKCPSKEILCGEKYLCKFGCVDRFNNSIPYQNFEEQ